MPQSFSRFFKNELVFLLIQNIKKSNRKTGTEIKGERERGYLWLTWRPLDPALCGPAHWPVPVVVVLPPVGQGACPTRARAPGATRAPALPSPASAMPRTIPPPPYGSSRRRSLSPRPLL